MNNLSYFLQRNVCEFDPPNLFSLCMKQVQRQLQLRIEAQGKYLKKIIEEQQRLGGVLVESPSSESDKKAEPATPVATSERPSLLLNKGCSTEGKTLSIDDSLSSRQEPSTPDSSSWCNNLGFGAADSKETDRRPSKKPRMVVGKISSEEEDVPQQILESSSGMMPYGSVFPTNRAV